MIVMDVAEEHCIDLLKLPPRANEPFKAAGSAVERVLFCGTSSGGNNFNPDRAGASLFVEEGATGVLNRRILREGPSLWKLGLAQ